MSSKTFEQLFAMSLRMATLATRFGLMLYLANKLSLFEFGIFSLYWAAVQLASSLIPLDVYAQTTRLLLSSNRDSSLLAKHFGFLLVAIIVFVPLASLLFVFSLDVVSCLLFFVFLLHLPLEVLVTDFGRLLIPLGRPLYSNLVLFIRSAMWVFPCIVIFEFGLAPKSTLLFIFGWLSGSFLAVVMGWCALRNYVGFPKFDLKWMVRAILSSGLFLLASMLFRVLLGGDRFLVSWKLDLEAVAIYSLYASVSFGILALVESGVSAWHYPRLVSAIRSKNSQLTKTQFFSFFVKNSVMSTFLVASVAVIFPFFVDIYLSPVFKVEVLGFYFMIAGAFFYCLSMPFHYCIYAASLDFLFVLIYFVSGVLVLIWVFFFMSDYGNLGAALMMFLSLSSISIMRVFGGWYVLSRMSAV